MFFKSTPDDAVAPANIQNTKTIIPYSQKCNPFQLCASQIFKTVNRNAVNKVFLIYHENTFDG